MYAKNTYCILLKEQTGKAPVMSLYMVPFLALASTAKQNTSCIAQISLGEHVINLGMHGNNVGLHIACGGCIGSVLVHVSLVSSSGAQQMVLD